ncbi:CHAT domain-containing protein, partial [Mycena epipterygia]
LAVALVARYQRVGDLQDINPAIELAREAVRLRPEAVQARLGTLAAALRIRFQRLSTSPDIEDALKYAQEAHLLTTKGSAERAQSLHTLGWIYRTKYEVGRDLLDLKLAIQHYSEALNFIPAPQLLRCLQGLSVSLGDRSQITRSSNRASSLNDATRALNYAQRIVKHTQDGDPDRAAYLQHVASSFHDLYRQTQSLEHLQEAISNTQHALHLAADRNPHRPRYLQNLALYLTDRSNAPAVQDLRVRYPTWLYKEWRDCGDLENALGHYRESFTGPTLQPMQSFDAAHRWASLAHLHKHDDCLTAYSAAFDLLPEILWIGNSLEVHRMACQVVEITQFTSNALRACIEYPDLKRAVELVEQGLATSLQQRLQLKTKVREPLLPAEDKVKLEGLSFILCNMDASMEERQKAAAKRHILLADIRSQPGLKSFLLPKKYAQLRHASKNGPVVILNSHESGCDAIILLAPTRNPLHVKLPRVSCQMLEEKRQMLNDSLRSRDAEENFKGLLNWLWDHVVCPVYEELNAKGIMDGRLWWCPTGSFIGLPLHAAAHSWSSQSSRFIQSYTLTLGALVDHHETQNSDFPKFGLVGVTKTGAKGEGKLPNIAMEMREIRSIVGQNHILEYCEEEATVGNVVKLLNDCPWLHLACHGDPNLEDPRKSCLRLYESSLDLDTIAQMQNPNAQLVFLAACKTAVGDSKLVNEALHLTGGFIAAGFQGVIGTLWSMSDDDGPTVSKTVYGHLFRLKGQAPKITDAAEALDRALEELRRSKVPYHRWVPFVHIGV